VILEGSGSGSTILWVPGSGLDDVGVFTPTASPTSTTTYILTVTEGNCTAQDEVLVTVNIPLTPPNTFTPNGDMVNDTWEIRRIEDYPNVQVSVYDRWGQRVFNSTGYASPWDGTNRGARLPVATYYYVIRMDLTDNDSGTISGSITIIK